VKKISTLIVFLFAFTSCSHYYYIPPTQNIPLFTEKKEIRATASLGGGDEINTFDLQAAYAITNRFAVMSAPRPTGAKATILTQDLVIINLWKST
jgi:hypothetical protein